MKFMMATVMGMFCVIIAFGGYCEAQLVVNMHENDNAFLNDDFWADEFWSDYFSQTDDEGLEPSDMFENVPPVSSWERAKINLGFELRRACIKPGQGMCGLGKTCCEERGVVGYDPKGQTLVSNDEIDACVNCVIWDMTILSNVFCSSDCSYDSHNDYLDKCAAIDISVACGQYKSEPDSREECKGCFRISDFKLEPLQAINLDMSVTPIESSGYACMPNEWPEIRCDGPLIEGYKPCLYINISFYSFSDNIFYPYERPLGHNFYALHENRYGLLERDDIDSDEGSSKTICHLSIKDAIQLENYCYNPPVTPEEDEDPTPPGEDDLPPNPDEGAQDEGDQNEGDPPEDDKLLISLGEFQTTHFGDHILVEWTTFAELDNAGFFLHRSDSPDGEYVRVNSAIVPSDARSGMGATYSYTDDDVKPGKTYFYKLEDVDYSGQRTFNGPVETVDRLTSHLAGDGKIFREDVKKLEREPCKSGN